MKIKMFLFLSLIVIMAFSAFGFAPMPMGSQAMTHDPFKVSGSSVSSCDMTYTVSEKHSTPKWWNVVDVQGTGQFALTQPHWKVTVIWEFLNSGYTVKRSASGTASQPTGCYTLCDETYDVVGEEIERYPNPADPAEMIIVKELFQYDMYTRDHLCGSGTTENKTPNEAMPYCEIGDPYGKTIWIWTGMPVSDSLRTGECYEYVWPAKLVLPECQPYVSEMSLDEMFAPKDGLLYRNLTISGGCDQYWTDHYRGVPYLGWRADCMEILYQYEFAIRETAFSVQYGGLMFSAQQRDDGLWWLVGPQAALEAQSFFEGTMDGPASQFPDRVSIPFEMQRIHTTARGALPEWGSMDQRILDHMFMLQIFTVE